MITVIHKESGRVGEIPDDSFNSEVFEKAIKSTHRDTGKVGYMPASQFESLESQGNNPFEIIKPDNAKKTEERNQDNESMMQWISREITKPAYKGLASIPDLPVVLGNLLVSGINKFAGTDIPQGKLPSDYVGEAVDYATNGLSQGEPTSAVGRGVEFATSMIGGGVAAKGLKEGSKLSSFAGSTKPVDVAGAAAMGATTQALENQGMDPIASTTGGLAAGIASPALLRKGASKINAPKIEASPTKMMQEDKATDVFQELKDNLPRAATSDSKTVAILDNVARKAPIAGDMLGKQTKKVNQNLVAGRDAVANRVGRTMDETEDAIHQLYQESFNHLPENAKIKPQNTLDQIDKINKKFGKLAAKDAGANKVVSEANKIKEAFTSVEKKPQILISTKPDVYSQPSTKRSLQEIGIKDLIDQKKAIYRMLKDKEILDSPKHELANLASAIRKDGEVYASNNLKFKEPFDLANNIYKRSVNRELFDKKLDPNSIGDEISFHYSNFVKKINKAKQDKKFVQAVGAKNLSKLEELADAAKKMKAKNFADPNKSGTAGTKALYGIIFSVVTAAATGHIGVATLTATSTLGGSYMLGKFLTNQKLIPKALHFAKSPTPENAKKFNNTLKAETGLSARELMSSIESQQQEDSDKNDKDKTQAKVTFKGSPGTEFIV